MTAPTPISARLWRWAIIRDTHRCACDAELPRLRARIASLQRQLLDLEMARLAAPTTKDTHS